MPLLILAPIQLVSFGLKFSYSFKIDSLAVCQRQAGLIERETGDWHRSRG